MISPRYFKSLALGSCILCILIDALPLPFIHTQLLGICSTSLYSILSTATLYLSRLTSASSTLLSHITISSANIMFHVGCSSSVSLFFNATNKNGLIRYDWDCQTMPVILGTITCFLYIYHHVMQLPLSSMCFLKHPWWTLWRLVGVWVPSHHSSARL